MVIVLAAISYLAWFSHQSSREIGMLNQLWREHSAKVNEKQQLLHEVKTRLGYNGFIHNFKNYVIRRDIRYLNRAKNQLESGLHIIDEYKQLDMRPIEEANVERLQGVIQNYQQKVTAIQHEEVVSLSVAKFDRLVKVDDSPALGALEDITSNIYTEYLRVKRQTDSLIEIIEYRMGNPDVRRYSFFNSDSHSVINFFIKRLQVCQKFEQPYSFASGWFFTM